MGYSGLIYAAIVAGWAAVLVPRWIRRNEEVERAREEDVARGVRVLDRSGRPVKTGHPTGTFTFSAPEASGADGEPPGADQPADVQPAVDTVPGASDGAAGVVAPLPGAARFSAAARRRRRVLTVLTLALTIVVAGTLAGRLPSGVVVVPAALLAGFLIVARRAAVAEQRRRARLIRAMRRKQIEAAQREEAAQPRRRVAVLDVPEPPEPVDPDAWEPVPVPLPTYLTKPKAPPQAIRKIDLSSAGAWTSGRLEPAGSVELPPAQREAPGSGMPEEHERRRAVGD